MSQKFFNIATVGEKYMNKQYKRLSGNYTRKNMDFTTINPTL